jgi:hypothetical protein
MNILLARPRMRLNPLVAACAIALSLAACGGSDDDHNHTPPVDDTPTTPTPVATPDSIRLSLSGRFSTGVFGESAAEIPAFDAASKRAFVVNAQKGTVDVLDMTQPTSPTYIGEINARAIAAGAEVNSVAVRDGVVALAIQAAVKTDPGFVGFYRADTLAHISHVGVGALPDMLTFTPDGTYVLAAIEAEPSDDYQIDPEGSISVINISNLAAPVVRTAGFEAWNGKEATLRAAGVRIFGPGANAARDFEPEYIAVSADSTTAWAVLQENNALARIDIAAATVTDILPLGYKDHGLPGNAMETNDEDKVINILPRPGVLGMYMPDAIASYTADGKTYLLTANEGDARAWGEDNPAYWAGDASKGFVEEFRVKHLVHNSGFARRAGDDLPPQLAALANGALLNPDTFAWCGATAGSSGDCRADEQLGRLNVTWTMGYRKDASGNPVMFNRSGVEDTSGDRLMYDNLYAFGARSFSVRDADGHLVWDSGDQFEKYLSSDECRVGTQRDIPCKTFFNSGHDEGNAMDSRSDAKGPEPEGIEVGVLGDKTFAFIGLERMGGIMVYDVTKPQTPVFVDYMNTRNDWTTEDPGTVLSTVGDLGPEGLKFVPAAQSPSGQPLLIVGNEVSGTTAVFTIEQTFAQKP